MKNNPNKLSPNGHMPKHIREQEYAKFAKWNRENPTQKPEREINHDSGRTDKCKGVASYYKN